jgi:4-hydroxy-2-oxoheptanedioate aldolase
LHGDRHAGEPAWAGRTNHLKQRLKRGERPLVMWVTLGWPEVPEILGTTGLDGVIVDLEHASYGLREVESSLRACEAAELTALVRPPSNDPALVARILDAGAYGIVFPMIQDAHSAELAVSSMRYQPRGARGWGGAHTRHARWQGRYAGAQARPGSAEAARSIYSREYVDKAEADLLTFLIVETGRGVEAIEAILRVDGIDGVIFGWGDFALETGFDWPRCHDAALRVYEACFAARVGCALAPGSELGDGFFPGCFYVVGIDSLIISSALSQAIEDAATAVSADPGPAPD